VVRSNLRNCKMRSDEGCGGCCLFVFVRVLICISSSTWTYYQIECFLFKLVLIWLMFEILLLQIHFFETLIAN
jgi:hypothetical protein